VVSTSRRNLLLLPLLLSLLQGTQVMLQLEKLPVLLQLLLQLRSIQLSLLAWV
jgi:hypothetical protein